MPGELSIVIPAYNEENRIQRAFRGLGDFFHSRDITPEIVVVCDGCTDNTAEISREFLNQSPFPHQVIEYQPNRGKGEAIRTGMLEANGTYRVFTDADLAADPDAFERFFPLFQQDRALIFGSRNCPGAKIEQHQPRHREVMGKAFTALSNFLLGTNVSDFTCGLKAFREDVAEDIFGKLTIDGWAFDAEIVFLANKYSYKITEVPVTWHDVEGSKVNSLKECPRSLRDLIRIRINDLKNQYDR